MTKFDKNIKPNAKNYEFNLKSYSKKLIIRINVGSRKFSIFVICFINFVLIELLL